MGLLTRVCMKKTNNAGKSEAATTGIDRVRQGGIRSSWKCVGKRAAMKKAVGLKPVSKLLMLSDHSVGWWW